jgi:hypothetical protein
MLRVRRRQHDGADPRVVEEVEDIDDEEAEQADEDRGQRDESGDLVEPDDRRLDGHPELRRLARFHGS